MKQIPTTEAVGHIICHDITRIIKDDRKDTPFKKGHIVRDEDIPVLLSLGKEHLYIWENKPGYVHENEAAEFLCGLCINDNMSSGPVNEGKIELIADIDGLFTVDINRLNAVNSLDEIIIATRHNNTPVKKGDKLAGTRVIPLLTEEKNLQRAKEYAGTTPLLSLLPYKHMKAGIVTTGSEVFHNRINDTFTPVVAEKLAQFNISATEHIIVDDNKENITAAIRELKSRGVEIILCTGGMSVDPDDRTPGAIKDSGARIVSYGAPVLPGSMFMLGYFEDNTPVMGLPGCVMFAKITVLDLILPRIAAGLVVTKADIAQLGHGGMCLSCSQCTYPNCGFGKGGWPC